MQSAAQPAQPDSKEEEKKKPLGDAASPSSSSASASQVQQRKDASTYQSLSESSAEACDQMIGNLKQAKSKVCSLSWDLGHFHGEEWNA